MGRRENIPFFKETGKLAEEFLGGDSVKPTNSPRLAEKMFKKGQLLGDYYMKNSRFKEDIIKLKKGLIKLLTLAQYYEKSFDNEKQDQIRNEMYKIKKTLKHKMLREALIRYTINAHPKEYTPWEPGPISEKILPRNEFITYLQEKLCEELNTTQYNKVQFYNAAGTPLDYLYSTDGFFTIDGSLFPDGKKRILPIDITLSRSKELKEFNPSGSLILFMEGSKLDDKKFNEYQREFASKIKDVLMRTPPDEALDGFASKFDKENESAKLSA